MRTIAITNQKGGCGKTTTAVNLSAACAKKGARVLVLDLDPQAHATLALGVVPTQLQPSIYEAIIDDKIDFSSIIRQGNIENLCIAPSNVLLSGAEIELADKKHREFILSQKLQPLRNKFDICVIDCSPSLSLLTLNALVASDELIIPVQTHYYAVEGLKQLLHTIEIVSEKFNRKLKIKGIVLTFVDNITLLSKDIEKQIRNYFGEIIFDTVIHRCVRLAEAPSAGESVITYDFKSKGAKEYMALADEVYDYETQSRITKKGIFNIW